jgi:hypothetical protein
LLNESNVGNLNPRLLQNRHPDQRHGLLQITFKQNLIFCDDKCGAADSVPFDPWIRFREKFFRIPTLRSDSKKKQLSKTKNIFYNAGGISDLLDPDPDQLTQMNPDLIRSRMIVAKDHLYLNVRQKSQFRGSNRRIFIMKGPETHYSK